MCLDFHVYCVCACECVPTCVACGTEMSEDILNGKMQGKVKFVKGYLKLDIFLNHLRILTISFKKLRFSGDLHRYHRHLFILAYDLVERPLHLRASCRDGFNTMMNSRFQIRKHSGHVSYHWAFRYHHRRKSTPGKVGEPDDQSTAPDYPGAEFFLWDHLRAKLYKTRSTGFTKLEKTN